jgi:RNA-directed DNA polymerase
LAMSLETPDVIRTLQRKLYRKAKAEPAYRFYLLSDKIYREDILHHAYRLARSKGGAPGVDGITFAMMEDAGVETWLAELRMELASKTYKAAPVRRVMIPKPGGGERPLGIPTIRDRVVQTAAKIVLEPVFEADLEENTYGYRPERSAADAIRQVHRLMCRGYTDVVDADLAKFFDTIPHDALLKSVARRIVDRHVLHLIKMWLKVPVEERDPSGTVIMTGGKSNQRGTPQGGVVSPRLSNLYMNRFLKHWRLTGRPAAFSAHVVAYADDFVILSRRHGHEALEWTREVMTKLGLTVHETKTSVKDARHQQFDFLGYAFGPQKLRRDGHVYLAASPSRKSVQRLKDKIGMMLTAGDKRPCEEVVTDLNRVLRGWANYFSHGTRMPAFRAIDHHVYDRMRNFLAKRHKVETRGTRRFSSNFIFGELGVLRLKRDHFGPRPTALR